MLAAADLPLLDTAGTPVPLVDPIVGVIFLYFFSSARGTINSGLFLLLLAFGSTRLLWYLLFLDFLLDNLFAFFSSA